MTPVLTRSQIPCSQSVGEKARAREETSQGAQADTLHISERSRDRFLALTGCAQGVGMWNARCLHLPSCQQQSSTTTEYRWARGTSALAGMLQQLLRLFAPILLVSAPRGLSEREMVCVRARRYAWLLETLGCIRLASFQLDFSVGLVQL